MDDLVVDFEGTLGHGEWGEHSAAGEACGAEAIAGGAIGDDLDDGVGHGVGVIGIHQQRGVAENFRHGCTVGSDDGQTATHGLERGQAEAFVETGEGEGRRAFVQRVQSVLIEIAWEINMMAELEMTRGLFSFDITRVGRTSNDQAQWEFVVDGFVGQFESTNQAHEIFIRVMSAHVQNALFFMGRGMDRLVRFDGSVHAMNF